jgi:hypothetical protein
MAGSLLPSQCKDDKRSDLFAENKNKSFFRNLVIKVLREGDRMAVLRTPIALDPILDVSALMAPQCFAPL